MRWKEFRSLLSGLNPDTPLGRVVQIRAETDPDVLKNFTPGQKKIHDEWQQRMAKEVSQADMERFLATMKNFFEKTGDVVNAKSEV